jgi:hypothetical protein
MTLQAGIWAIDGGNMNGQIARLFYRSATRNNQGIVEIGDLRVRAETVPAGSVKVGDGAAIVRGKEILWQGSYWVYNLGDSTVAINPTAGAARHDLVWLRIEDSTFSGSPWSGDPAAAVLASLVVTEGVSAGTTKIPNGFSGIPLARIDIPVSTTNITSGMIVDLREMSDPRTHLQQFSLQGVWASPDSVGNIVADYELFPNGASWDVDIPTWASQAVVSFTFGGLEYLKSGGNGTGSTFDARGLLRVKLGTQATQNISYWVRQNVTEYTRVTYAGGDDLNLPVAVRGTTQTLEVQGKGTTNFRGSLQADGYTGLVVSVLFREVPVSDALDRTPA